MVPKATHQLRTPPKPLAIVVIGGLITGTILTLFIFPLVFEHFYRSEHTKYLPLPGGPTEWIAVH